MRMRTRAWDPSLTATPIAAPGLAAQNRHGSATHACESRRYGEVGWWAGVPRRVRDVKGRPRARSGERSNQQHVADVELAARAQLPVPAVPRAGGEILRQPGDPARHRGGIDE